MMKFAVGFFAVTFQLVGLVFYTAASPDYGFTMMATFVNELIAFLLYLWLFFLLNKSKTILLILGIASSAALGLWALAGYVDIRGFLG